MRSLNEGKRLPAADIAIWMQDQRPKTSAVKAYEDERRAAIVVIKEFRKQIRAGCFLQLDFKKAADLAPAPYNNEAEVKRLYEFYKAQFVVPLAFPNGLFAKIWKELRNDQKKKCGLDSCTRRFQSGTEIYKNLAHSYAALRDWNMYGDQAFSYLLSDKKRVRKFVVLWKTVLEIVRKALPDDSQWNPEKLAKDFLSNDHAHCEALFALDDPHVLAIVKATVFLILMELLQAHKSNIIRMSDLLDVIPYSDQTIRNAMDALVNTRYNVKKDGKNRSAHWIIPESFADLWRKENPYLDANAFVAASKCVFRCCRTRIPIPVGQHSGVAGQFSERSDALEEVIEMCPTGVNLFPGFSACFGAPPRGDAPAVNPTLDRAVYSGGR